MTSNVVSERENMIFNYWSSSLPTFHTLKCSLFIQKCRNNIFIILKWSNINWNLCRIMQRKWFFIFLMYFKCLISWVLVWFYRFLSFNVHMLWLLIFNDITTECCNFIYLFFILNFIHPWDGYIYKWKGIEDWDCRSEDFFCFLFFDTKSN